jgi:hypothetical protein
MWMFALACAVAPSDPAGTDDSVSQCAPVGLDRAQDWTQADLIQGEPRSPQGNAGVGLADVNGDGWLDALLVTPEGSLLVVNDGAGTLVPGTEKLPRATSVALADVDGDGDVDAWLGQPAGQHDLILYNDGTGVFDAEIVKASTGEHYSGTWGDLDGDGDPDLFVAGYAHELSADAIRSGDVSASRSWIYRNDGGELIRVDDALPAEVQDDVTFQGQLLDVEGDGDLDLYLANDFGPWLGRNRLLLNDGTGHFTIDDTCGCDLATFSMGVSVGDPDGDGDPDLYLTDLGGPRLLLNDGTGRFYDATAALDAGVPNAETQLASWGAAFVDLDRDGWQDVAMVFGQLHPGSDGTQLHVLGQDYTHWRDGADQHDALLINQAGAGFLDSSGAAGFDDPQIGRALAVGDLDRDGRPDVVTAGLWYATQWKTHGGCDSGLTLQLPIDGALTGQGLDIQVGERSFTRFPSPSTTWSSSAQELPIAALPTDPVTVRSADGTVLFDGWGDDPRPAVGE